MRYIRFLFSRRHVNLHLPRYMRLSTHTVAVGIGISFMLVGSAVAHNAHGISHAILIHPLIIDAGGYFLHGVGCIPAMVHFEKLWQILGE